jgi:hypothetical protein
MSSKSYLFGKSFVNCFLAHDRTVQRAFGPMQTLLAATVTQEYLDQLTNFLVLVILLIYKFLLKYNEKFNEKARQYWKWITLF